MTHQELLRQHNPEVVSDSARHNLDAVSTPLSLGLFGDALPPRQGGGRSRAFPTGAKKANGYISFPKAGKLLLLPANPSTTKNTIKQQECVKNKHRHASAFRIPVPRARGARAAGRRNVVLHREPSGWDQGREHFITGLWTLLRSRGKEEECE